jgi:hypothetical protein
MKEVPESQVFGYNYGRGRLCIFFCGSKIKQKHIRSLKTFFTAIYTSGFRQKIPYFFFHFIS